VACLHNGCCCGNATIRSLSFAVDLHVAVNNIKQLSVAMETQEWVHFALLWSYKIFCAAVNNTNVLTFPHKMTNNIV
jgi:hypothetical protein